MMKKTALFITLIMLVMSVVPTCRAYADDAEKKNKDTESVTEEKTASDEKSEGDGKSEAYEDIKDKVWNSTDESLNELMDGAKEMGKNITDGIWRYVFYMYDIVSAIYPGVLFFSILIGCVVAVMSSKNKKVRKRAIVIGVITVPVVLTAIVYILPYLYLRLS